MAAQSRFADWDGDGYPDHVLAADGFWYAFDPRTGAMPNASPPSTISREGNSSSGLAPVSVGGGAQGGLVSVPQPAQPPPVAPASQPLPSPSAGAPLPPPPPSGGGSSMLPSYRNGLQHPAQSGQKLTPGGQFNTGMSSGPAPLPFTPKQNDGWIDDPRGHYGGTHPSGFSPNFNGGGGSHMDVRSRIGQMRSKLQSSFGGGSSGSYGSATSSNSFRTPKPAEPAMKGLAKGMDPQQAEVYYQNPEALLFRVAKGMDPDSPFYETLTELPASQLALLGTSGKKATDRNQVSQYVNALGNVYTDATTGTLPTFEQMTKDLITAKPKSALGQLMRPERPERTISGYGRDGKPRWSREEPDYFTSPLSTAANTMSGLVGAIGQASALDDRAISAYSEMADFLTNQFINKAVNKPAYKMPLMSKQIGKSLFF